MEETPQCHQETRQIQINDLNPVSDDEEKEKEEEIELPKQASISEALSVIDFNKIRSKDLPPLPGTEPTTPPTTGKKRKRDEVEKDDQEEEEDRGTSTSSSSSPTLHRRTTNPDHHPRVQRDQLPCV